MFYRGSAYPSLTNHRFPIKKFGNDNLHFTGTINASITTREKIQQQKRPNKYLFGLFRVTHLQQKTYFINLLAIPIKPPIPPIESSKEPPLLLLSTICGNKSVKLPKAVPSSTFNCDANSATLSLPSNSVT